MKPLEAKKIPGSAKKYLSFFRIRFSCGLQYRVAAYAGIATQFAWGFGEVLLYKAFYATGASSPMTLSQMCSYIWMRQAFLGLFMSWYFDPDILEMISSGSVAYELCRPCDLYSMWFIKNLALRSSRCALRCLPILAVAFFLPEPIRMSLPESFPRLLAFLASLVLGALITVAFAMLIYTSIFHTVSSVGVRLIAVNVVAFASGELIPSQPEIIEKFSSFRRWSCRIRRT